MMPCCYYSLRGTGERNLKFKEWGARRRAHLTKMKAQYQTSQTSYSSFLFACSCEDINDLKFLVRFFEILQRRSGQLGLISLKNPDAMIRDNDCLLDFTLSPDNYLK